MREILVHIAAWDRELVRGLDELVQGRRPSFADYDEAAFNAEAVGQSRGPTLGDAIREAQDAHRTVIDRIAALSDEEWERTSPFRWANGEAMTTASLFQYTYNGQTHYAGHAEQVERGS